MSRQALLGGVGLLLVVGSAQAFDPFSSLQGDVERGNSQYAAGQFEPALEAYEIAEEQVPNDPRIQFNRGNTLFKLQRMKEAREAFLRASATDDPELKKRNYYDLGNTFLAEKALAEAADAYQKALEIDPGYEDARFNLEWILHQQEEQKKQDKQDGQDDKNKNEQKDQNQPPKPQSPQDQEQKPDQQQDNPLPQDRQANQGQEKPTSPERMNQEQVKDFLDAMQENEKPFQLQRFQLPQYQRKPKTVEKDW